MLGTIRGRKNYYETMIEAIEIEISVVDNTAVAFDNFLLCNNITIRDLSKSFLEFNSIGRGPLITRIEEVRNDFSNLLSNSKFIDAQEEYLKVLKEIKSTYEELRSIL